MTVRTPQDDLMEVLADFGVRSARVDLREELAEKLHGEGMTPDELRVIGETMRTEAKSWQQAARWLAALLEKPAGEWRPFLENIRRAERSWDERDDDSGDKRAEFMRSRQNLIPLDQYQRTQAHAYGQSDDEYRRERWELYLVARVRGDGYDPQVVAEQEGISLQDLSAILDRHEGYLAGRGGGKDG